MENDIFSKYRNCWAWLEYTDDWSGSDLHRSWISIAAINLALWNSVGLSEDNRAVQKWDEKATLFGKIRVREFDWGASNHVKGLVRLQTRKRCQTKQFFTSISERRLRLFADVCDFHFVWVVAFGLPSWQNRANYATTINSPVKINLKQICSHLVMSKHTGRHFRLCLFSDLLTQTDKNLSLSPLDFYMHYFLALLYFSLNTFTNLSFFHSDFFLECL